MSDTPTVLSLDARLTVIEERLGIDPAAVLADQAASNAAGAEAHLGNAQSDVAPPAVPESVEDALSAANEADNAQAALDHVVKALEKWPEDEELLQAKADLEKVVADEAAEADQS